MAQQQPSRRVLEWIKQQQAEAGDASRKTRKTGKTKARGSLDDALQNDPAAFGNIPQLIPLPGSRDGSSAASDPGERDPNADRSSLDLIHRDGTFVLPSAIPLPPSLPPSPKLGPVQRQATDKPRQKLQSYAEIIDRASGVFDHIANGNIRKIPRVERTSIMLYEYYDDNTASSVEIDNPELVSSYRDTPEGLSGRVFIVEDLSERTIHALGETFGVTPEFFEEHLLNSGYSGAQYDDPPARSWKTAGLNKSYVSIQWVRPMYRRQPLFSNRDREDLLDLNRDGLDYISGNSIFSLKAETNIFRPEWDLRVDPRRTAKETREFGLVERASVWKKKAEGRDYEIVIVLLDPLPAISYSHDETQEIQMIAAYADVNRDEHDTGDDNGAGTRPILIIEGDDGVEALAIPIENPRRETTGRRVLDWLRRRQKHEVHKRKVNLERTIQVLVKQMASRKTVTIDLEEAIVTGDFLATLQDELNETRSTGQEIHHMVDKKTTPVSLLDTLFETIRQDTLTLLRVLNEILSDMEVDILDDTKMEDRLALWRQLISKAERELSDLITSIRAFLAFFGITLPANTSLAAADGSSDIVRSVLDLFDQINQMLARLRRASSSLTSNMGLLDSRRSIDEAHAITRLTELAFLFIPLSFSTSVFGMQIEPFKDSAPVWKFFVVASAVTTFAYLMRLTMRSQWLASLKQNVKLDVRRYAEQRGLPVQVRSLSMLLLLQWFGTALLRSSKATWVWIDRNSRKAGTELWRVVGFPLGLFLMTGIVAVAPIAVLWTRSMDQGVQGTVTGVVIVAILGLVGVPYWRRSNPDFRYAFPRMVMRLLERIPSTIRVLVLWALGIMALVAIPLALIWTRPLASGIKAGLTAAILVILITGVGFLGAQVLYFRAAYFSWRSTTSEETSVSGEATAQYFRN
ncbi:hypothetical protein ABOM_001491 [Aspergillus bombycis]|uniref:CorA family metal ion transporter n=1 Tax=Aspergillus bombycis TaxID=109264 RepID=A0A1F8ADP6_9EURO|nr:hypothetical protein ABOM_001491 [Aspergillus bombycis]OGM49812.1 hypothetical protein ABOM_001491 [Aspergillus bombycis]